MSGRPKKACGTCQLQKIRCTGERPACKRCVRLKHRCSYPVATKTPRSAETLQQTRPRQPAIAKNSHPTYLVGPVPGTYLGIPTALISELIETYFEHVPNSSLVLHETRFLESVHARTVAPHVLYSVCAFGANFYKDSHGCASLKTNGFMTDWARQAGNLAFQEIESYKKDLVVTFLNLTLFWHSQGSWKVSSLYKANAFHFLCIHGIGDALKMQMQTFDVEVQRRHFWSWYIMHCHATEGSGVLELVGDISSLPLPWPEEDFKLASSNAPTVSLASTEGSNSIFAELAKVMTLWSQAVKLVKVPETSLTADRVASIYALDEKLSLWWRRLPTGLKLEAELLANVPASELPRLLLTNLVYHQTLCVLHASIVPLFCWTEGDDGWASTRQLSAQIAYEHACTVSTLIRAVLTSYPKLSAMPTFVAYAAYGGCAILIPFMWCSNLAVRCDAQANIRTNIRMIQDMADYWKFAALLVVHVNCLYSIHKRNPPALDDEPKYTDVRRLTGFKTDALYARVSILEFLGILRKGPSSFAEPGEEIKDLGIKQSAGDPHVPLSATTTPGMHEVSPRTPVSADHSGHPVYGRNDLPNMMQSQQWNLLPPSGADVDLFSSSLTFDEVGSIGDRNTAHLMLSDLDYEPLDIEEWDYEQIMA